MNKLYSSIVLAAFMFSTALFAQNFSISGVVTDASTGEALIGANVYLNALNTGATTNSDGVYVVENIPKGTYEIAASYVGYIKEAQNAQVLSDVSLNFTLRQSAVLMEETVVQGTRATLRETPVAFTEITGEEIEFKLASRDLPQMLNTLPSVYSSMAGGGAGDADLHVRGFNQRDIAIMINGVPVNDMENGWVYWSNWAGLGDVTKSLQVQRGLGASPYSVNAIGGIVNVETHGAANRQEFVRIKTEFGADNLSKLSIAFSTALTENIGFTFLGSRKTWDGYAVNTPLDEYTYFFSFGGVFGNHSLELTGLGSPQEHGQRLYEQTITTWGDRGFNYNPNWGYLNGRVVWERYNKFSKPQFNLNWNWQMSDQTILSSTGYLSVGSGYGTGHIGSGVIFARDAAGQYAYDNVWAINTANIDTNYSSSLTRSVSAIRESHNNHFWVGLLSTLKHNFSSNLTLNFGIDGRYYVGEHYRTLSNMIGGDYFLETNDKNNPDKLASIGDTVAYNNDGIVTQYGGFAQLEYNTNAFSIFLNVSGSNTGYNRIDYFNFLTSDPDRETGNSWFPGGTAKTGINFNLDEHNNIFANVGYFSRAPIFDNVYDFGNNIYSDIVNEKILGVEGGYGLSTPKVALVINGFYTKWEDRAISRSVINSTTGMTSYFNIVGANQRHVGVEFEGRWKPLRELEFNGSYSYAENIFTNDVKGRIAPEDDPSDVTEINAYVKDLYVGAFPMTNASIAMVYHITLTSGTSLTINPVWKFLGRFFTDFDPVDRDDPDDREQSWEIPSYSLLDAHAALDILFTDFFFKRMNISFHLFNALNTVNYIVQGTDGSTHTRASAEVFYGRARWWNIGVMFDF